MYREQIRRIETLGLLLDAVCIGAAFVLALALRIMHESIPVLRGIWSVPWDSDMAVQSEYAMVVTISLGVWVLALKRYGVHGTAQARLSPKLLLTHLKASLWALLATGGGVFALKMGSISRLFYAYYFVLAMLLLLAKHKLFALFLRRMRRGEAARRHVLVVGAAHPAAWFSGVLAGAETLDHQLIEILISDETKPDEHFDIPVIGSVRDLDRTLKTHPVDEVFIVGGAGELAELSPVAQRLIEAGKVVSLVSAPGLLQHGVRGRVTEFSGVPMISFGPMPKDELHLQMKRLLDVAVSLSCLVALAPVMAAVALLIKIFDPGPVIFSHERLGMHGKKFRLHKFRSMRVEAEKLLRADPSLYARYVANDYKLSEEEDPRISALGRFLRKSSLDELPQLWNVLKGEMSLVGPRPIVPDELERYQPYAEVFLAARPGLTGRWQVDGRSRIRYPERAFLELDYVGENSVATDLSIIAKTVPAVLRRKGAR